MASLHGRGVVLVALEVSQLEAMARTALALARDHGARVLLVCAFPAPDAGARLRLLQAETLPRLELAEPHLTPQEVAHRLQSLADRPLPPLPPPPPRPGPVPAVRRMLQELKEKGARGEAPGWEEFLRAYRLALEEYLARRAQVEALVALWRAEVVILGGDSPRYASFLWRRVVRARGGACFSLTAVYPLPQKTATILARAHGPSPCPEAERMLARHFPAWFCRLGGRPVAYLPAHQALAQQALGVAPRIPWLNAGHPQDTVALDSDFTRHHLAGLGLSPEALVVTGTPVHDHLHRLRAQAPARRRELCQRHGLDPQRPLLVSSLPKDYFSYRAAPGFGDYLSLCRFWLEALAGLQHLQAVICPHPQVPAPVLDWLEGMGAVVKRVPVSDLLPLADLYLAPLSTTMKWARALGQPVLNYDCYAWERFPEVEGVTSVYHPRDFLAVLRAWDSPSAWERLRQEARRNQTHWGRIDGRAGRRIAALVRELWRAPSRQHPAAEPPGFSLPHPVPAGAA